MNRIVPLMLALAVVGCGPEVVTETQIQRVAVPVPQPCVAGLRPAEVVPLKSRIPRDQWRTLDARQKAAHVGKQGLDRQTYGEQLGAATGACS